MLLSLTKPVRIAVGPGGVNASADGERMSIESMLPQGFDQSLILTKQIFSKVRAQHLSGGSRWLRNSKPDVAILLDNAWVRIFVSRWDYALKTTNDFLRYADIEFERRFHADSQLWQLVPDRLRPGAETVWCAYEKVHLAALDALAAEENIAIQSTMPLVFAELASVSTALALHSKSPIVYLGGGDTWRNICWVEDSRIRDLVALKISSINEQALAQLLMARLNLNAIDELIFLRIQGGQAATLRAVLEATQSNVSITRLALSQAPESSLEVLSS